MSRRYKSRVVKMKFQSFFDISTRDGEMQIISVNAGGKDVLKRLAPFFSAYKYYKLGGVSFKLIPASTLPVDPTGLSYEEGENTVDPRDQLTPGMCRITNGEDIFEDITGMTAENQHKLYDNMLLDPRWYKWMLQTGVKRFGKPRYWQIGQLHQDKWPGAVTNLPFISSGASTSAKATIAVSESIKDSLGNVQYVQYNNSSHLGLFQTGHRGVLGWMPTDALQQYATNSTGDSVGPRLEEKAFLASPPEIELFKILMPPAYKTKYYYRAFITETVYFRDPIVMNVNGYRPIDVFHFTGYPSAGKPDSADAFNTFPSNSETGGNYGSS